MLKNIFIISSLLAAVSCFGEVTVMLKPSSVEFKPCKTHLESEDFGSFMKVLLGETIYNSTGFDCVLVDPFIEIDNIIIVTLKGVSKINYKTSETTPTFSVNGNNGLASIQSTSQKIRDEGLPVLHLDLTNENGLQTLHKISDNNNVNTEGSKCSFSRIDNEQHLAQFVGFAKFAENFKSSEIPTLISIALSSEWFIGDEKLFDEVLGCYIAALKKLTENAKEATGGNTLILSYATKSDASNDQHKRQRRAADNSGDDDYNLAKTYDDNYPVIFNIILWFGVVIAFSLYAISYAIATMDPGRDSIIYRMTSTRIKKDN